MKKAYLAVLVALSALTTAAYAQSDNGGTMSIKPAKAADVEQRAQDLQAKQQAMESAPLPAHQPGTTMKHKKAPKAE